MLKIVPIQLAISSDLCRDRGLTYCSTTRDHSGINRFLFFFPNRTGFSMYASWTRCDNDRPPFLLFFSFCVAFFPLCFIIGDREFLTGGPPALRHTRCLLGRRMFFLFLLFYRLCRDKSGTRCLSDLSLRVKIKIVFQRNVNR